MYINNERELDNDNRLLLGASDKSKHMMFMKSINFTMKGTDIRLSFLYHNKLPFNCRNPRNPSTDKMVDH